MKPLAQLIQLHLSILQVCGLSRIFLILLSCRDTRIKTATFVLSIEAEPSTTMLYAELFCIQVSVAKGTWNNKQGEQLDGLWHERLEFALQA